MPQRRRSTIYLLIAAALGTLGILLMAFSISQGEGSVSLIVVIPVFIGTGGTAAVGVLSLVGAFFFLFFGLAARSAEGMVRDNGIGPAHSGPADPFAPDQHQMAASGKPERRTEGGAVILLGPIPIVIGSNASMTKLLMIIGVILTVVAVIAFLVFNRIVP